MSELGSVMLQKSIEMSRAYVERPDTYQPFDHTADGLDIVDCIEPCDPKGTPHGEYKVVRQTGGGGVGPGSDTALAVRVLTERPVTTEEGMALNKKLFPGVMAKAHRVCTFLGSMGVIVSEQGYPTDATIDTFDRLAFYLGMVDDLRAPRLRIQDAARQQEEDLLSGHEPKQVLEAADALHPDHANVWEKRGDTVAQHYVFSFLPDLGMDRNQKPADPDEAQLVQAYHVSIGANVEALKNAREVSDDMRLMLLTAMLMRESATLTTIANTKTEPMSCWGVYPAANEHGMHVVEERIV